MDIANKRDAIKEAMVEMLVHAGMDITDLGNEIGIALMELTYDEETDFICGIRHGLSMHGKHEYLEEKDYYECRAVGTGARSSKTCEHCGEEIPKGEPHDMHKFYDDEWPTYPTHSKCSDNFKKSLR